MSEWKTIEGYSDYEISNKGEVRSFKFGKIRILKQSMSGYGYLKVMLCNNGEKKQLRVHQLVLETFIGPCPDGKECNHQNGIKSENQLSNLEWVTSSENIQHAVQTGLKFQKPVQQFTLDGQFIAEYKSQNEAFRQTGVHQGNISSCCNGQRKNTGGFVWRLII